MNFSFGKSGKSGPKWANYWLNFTMFISDKLQNENSSRLLDFKFWYKIRLTLNITEEKLLP